MRVQSEVNRKISEMEAENERLEKLLAFDNQQILDNVDVVAEHLEQAVLRRNEILFAENERLRGLLSETIEHLNEGWDCSGLVDRIEDALKD